MMEYESDGLCSNPGMDEGNISGNAFVKTQGFNCKFIIIYP
jgi:hypothetical protein